MACVNASLPAAWTQTGAQCLGALGDAARGALSAADVAALPAAAFGGGLRPSGFVACEGFSAAQLGKVAAAYPNTQCSALAPACAAKIVPAALGQLTGGCLASLTAATVGALDADQVAQVPAAAFAKLTKMAAFGAAACAGLQPGQLGALANSYPYAACQDLSAACAGAVRAQSWAGVSARCWSSMPTAAVGKLNNTAVSDVPAANFAGFSAVGALSADGCRGLQGAQLAKLSTVYPYTDCQSIGSLCVAAIDSKALRDISTGCIKALPPAAFAGFSKKQWESVPAAAMADLAPTKVAALPAKTCAGFTQDQLTKIGTSYPYNTCSQMPKACLGAIEDLLMSAISVRCVSSLPLTAMPGLTTLQMSQMQPKTVAALSGAQLGALDPNTCGAIHPEHWAVLATSYPYTQCNQLSAACVSQVGSLSKISARCFAGFGVEQRNGEFGANGLTAALVASVPPAAMSAFTALDQLSPFACAGLTGSQTGVLSTVYPYTQCHAMGGSCLSNITVPAYGAMSARCVSALATLDSLVADQLRALMPNAVQLSAAQVGTLAAPACTGWTAAGLTALTSQYPNTQCAGFSATCFSAIANATLQGVTEQCMAALEPFVYAGQSMDRILHAFPPAAMQGATKQQIAWALVAYGKPLIDASPDSALSANIRYGTAAGVHELFDPTSELAKQVQLKIKPYVDDLQLTGAEWLRATFATAAAAAKLRRADFADRKLVMVQLRAAHAKQVAPSALVGIGDHISQSKLEHPDQDPDVPFAAPDFVAALSSAQTAEIDCEWLHGWRAQVPALSADGLSGLTANALGCAAHDFPRFSESWPCSFVVSLSAAQFTSIVANRGDSESNRLRACRGLQPQAPAPGYSPPWDTPAGHPGTGRSTYTPGTVPGAPGSTPSRGLGPGAVVGISFGLIAAGVIGAALAILYVRRRDRMAGWETL